MKKFIRYSLISIGALIVVSYLIFALGLGIANHLASKKLQPEQPLLVRSIETHQIRLLDSGILSLHQRLQMIQEAKKSIELEFFIYEIDEASRILTQALVKKAKEGVKVRILVDFSAPVFQLKPVYASFLKFHGIEVRYYNTSAIYRLVSSQHRSHRKLLIADGTSVITGGRNIGNDYFDLSEKYNFLDSDIYLKGPLAEKIRDSFDLYWNSDLSEKSENIEGDLSNQEMAQAADFFLEKSEDQKTLETVHRVGTEKTQASPMHECKDTTFVTDYPYQGEENRKVFSEIVKVVSEAQHQIVAESPYFVLKSDGLAVLKKLGDRGVHLKVLTNSLKSTDASYAVSALMTKMHQLGQTGLSLYAFQGNEVPGQSFSEFTRTNRWGVHSKRAVVDDQTVMVGTYNIDPRSANLNSELMVVCRGNQQFAKEVLKGIEQRMQVSWNLIDKGQEKDVWQILKDSTFNQKFMFVLLLPISNLFDFLL